MKASEMLWERLEEEGLDTRGEASEEFAYALFAVMKGMIDFSPNSNGTVIDAMEAALDILTEDEGAMERFVIHLAESEDEDIDYHDDDPEGL